MAGSSNSRGVWDQAARDADLTVELPGGVPMFFRRIPPGRFRMGARGEGSHAEPVHHVRIPYEFYLGTFVVTQEQYRAVAARCPALKKAPDPSSFKGPRHPVDQVSWLDATAFCAWLTRWEKLPKEIALARLPTEAEWEYACRAGSDTDAYNGNGETALAEVAWFDANSNRETHPVDVLPEVHPFKLYGMHGNVWEWCQDVYDRNAYRKREDEWMAREWSVDDAGEGIEYWTDEDRKASKNPRRVLRGGSWIDSASDCRSAFRDGEHPGIRNWFIGFRLVLVPGPEQTGRGAPRDENREAELAPGDGVGRRGRSLGRAPIQKPIP